MTRKLSFFIISLSVLFSASFAFSELVEISGILYYKYQNPHSTTARFYWGGTLASRDRYGDWTVQTFPPLSRSSNVSFGGHYLIIVGYPDANPVCSIAYEWRDLSGNVLDFGGDFIVPPGTIEDWPPEIFPDLDSDGDGVPDIDDAFPNDPTEDTDTDGDGVGDNSDAFPNDPTEDTDTDGDGIGDNADEFPNDPTDGDSDGDGIPDIDDPFPDDPDNFPDEDGDGIRDDLDPFIGDGNENYPPPISPPSLDPDVDDIPPPPFDPGQDPDSPPADPEYPDPMAEGLLRVIADNTHQTAGNVYQGNVYNQAQLYELYKQSSYLDGIRLLESHQSQVLYDLATTMNTVGQSIGSQNLILNEQKTYLGLTAENSASMASDLELIRGYNSDLLTELSSADLARIAPMLELLKNDVGGFNDGFISWKEGNESWSISQNQHALDQLTELGGINTGMGSVKDSVDDLKSSTDTMGQGFIDFSGTLDSHHSAEEGQWNDQNEILDRIADNSDLDQSARDRANQLMEEIKNDAAGFHSLSSEHQSAVVAWINTVLGHFDNIEDAFAAQGVWLTDTSENTSDMLAKISDLNSAVLDSKIQLKSELSDQTEELSNQTTELSGQTELLEEIAGKEFSISNSVKVAITNDYKITLTNDLALGSDDGNGFSGEVPDSDLPDDFDFSDFNDMADPPVFSAFISRFKNTLQNFFSLNLPEVGKQSVWTSELPSFKSIDFPPLKIDLGNFPVVSILRRILVFCVVVSTIFRAQKMIAGIFA